VCRLGWIGRAFPGSMRKCQLRPESRGNSGPVTFMKVKAGKIGGALRRAVLIIDGGLRSLEKHSKNSVQFQITQGDGAGGGVAARIAVSRLVKFVT
jgi:hypothetical protein